MSAGEDEIELKFLCEPADLAVVLAAAPHGETHEKALVSTYYDTPQGDLRKARISLRIREGGGKRVQTLKRGDGFAREEHEQAITTDGLDLGFPALKDALPPAKRKTLSPIFTVRVVRRQRTFEFGGSSIELAVDEGEVQAGERARRISEVELELKGGDCRPLFDLARELSRTAPLYLSFDGKATQGQGLIDGSDRSPRRHDKAPLARGLTAAGAFQAIARNTLVQIAANGVVLREADSVEAVHQLRVAVRRGDQGRAEVAGRGLRRGPRPRCLRRERRGAGRPDPRSLGPGPDGRGRPRPGPRQGLRRRRLRALPRPGARHHRLGGDRRLAVDGRQGSRQAP